MLIKVPGIEVGPFHYSVISDAESDRELGDRQLYGDCSHMLRRIRVASDTSREQFTCTFLHEAIEAINNVWCNDKMEHALITNVAYGLAQMCRGLGIEFYADQSPHYL